MKTVEQLRKEGCKVRVIHRRAAMIDGKIKCPERLTDEQKKNIVSTGGETIVQVNINGRELEGIARCNKSDFYNKKRGVAIALGRALKQ